MAFQIDNSIDSNDYFFVNGIHDGKFTVGKNTLTVNPSAKVKSTIGTSNIIIIDPAGNRLNVYTLIPTDSTGYDYSEGSGKIFGVLVPPTTKAGVGRIEIRALALPIETVSASAILSDKRFPPDLYSNVATNVTPVDTLWTRAVSFDPSKRNESEVRFFDFPEMTATSEIYEVMNRPTCGTLVVSGECNGIANDPKHGSNADYNYNISSTNYTLNTLDNSRFSSDMVGASIRLTNISIGSISYVTSRGERKDFAGPINGSFIAKILSVLTDGSLVLDRPFTVSNVVLEGLSEIDSSPYKETTQTTVKKYDTFNEVDQFSLAGRSSGIQQQQLNQIYNVDSFGYSHRRSYYVSNVSSATYEIVYLPREITQPGSFTYTTTNNGEFSKHVCLAKVELTGLRTWTGELNSYKIYKKSLNYPETSTIVAEGRLTPNELLFDWFAGADTSHVGRFYNLAFAQKYWLATGSVSYDHTPSTLIDSITIKSAAGENDQEDSYVILKADRDEPGRTAEYVMCPLQSDDSWRASPKLYTNHSVEPTSSYDCVYFPINSIEVNHTGPVYNSNSIKVLKNTMYTLSVDFAAISQENDSYSLVIYFISTQNGLPIKTRIGEINKKSIRGYRSGTYTTSFFSGLVRYGTILLVPKNMSSICIGNISLRPFSEFGFSLDSTTIYAPINVVAKNERIELTTELFDYSGKLVYGTNCNAFESNQSLRPLKDTIVVDPSWITLNAFDRS